MSYKANKSVYLFLCAFMGAMLFLIVQRTIVLIYYMLIGVNESLMMGLTHGELNVVDFFTMIVAMLAGVWYGIWLGQYWYGIVYEHGYFGGVFHHLLYEAGTGRTKHVQHLRNRIDTLKKHVQEEVFEIEELAQEMVQEAKPAARKKAKPAAPRKRTVKKTI